ncbi:rhomboid family protein [Sutcliffiella horikoshii]|uniref:rhomboid family protein n=1 Tax=Sutcliffiella horikoshii TaxID=79883 RepID=UPI001EEF0B49|nr:rhomboid family intramembrane serine protease [Sutcliffiella horikoshii]MCG1022645.1 rhomboid family intramembrane serine protease [Sutcliffiella horikoshii]
MKQDIVFWQLVQHFVIKKEYRILHISPDQMEVWLEGLNHKKAPIIRLYRHDLDWSTWLQRDIENASHHVVNFKNQLRKRSLHALNIYVSSYPPVDDWEFRIEEPFIKNKAELHSIVVHEGNLHRALNEISNITGDEVEVKEDLVMEEQGLYHLKQSVLNASSQRVKMEQSIFQHGKPLFTYLFIFLHLVMFYLLETNGGSQNPETLVQYGAKYNPAILEGEWWRFFTPIVLHIGVLHLLLNTMALFYLGSAVERIYGNARFLLIYLFAGFAGSLASFVFTSSLSAGASGAIFGCFGALLFVGMTYPKLFFRTMGMNILVLIGINLAIGFTIPGIDNAGHIGGLIGGFLASAVVHLPKHKKTIPRVLGLGAAVGLTYFLLIQGYDSENPNLLLSQAETMIQQEDFEEARGLLTQLEDKEKEYPEVLFYLSFINIKEGRIEEAREQLERLTAIAPEFHEAYYNLALVYLELDETQKASSSINKAVELDSKGENYINLQTEINRMVEGD